MKNSFSELAKWLTKIPNTLPEKPKAILAISGHWENSDFTVSTSPQPPMVYDYSGFPDHTYQIKYEAPGSPILALRVKQLLNESGINCNEDPNQGFDHGTFVPLFLMYPNAEIPVVQLSLKKGYDPKSHIEMGKALMPLREEGVLIIGSGLSYHNLRAFGPPAGPISEQFEKWLTESVTLSNSDDRNQRLINWETAPTARQSHPREDHLVPLMVVSGAAGKDLGYLDFLDKVWGITMASYRFG